jgi:hypothetical protein
MTSVATVATARIPSVYPGILRKMPKVMVSMPDELLAEVDAEAKRTGSNRSAVLRGYAEAAIQQRRAHRAEELGKLVRRHAAPHGGNLVELIKASRPN